MRRTTLLVLSLVLLVLVSACGNGGGSPLPAEDSAVPGMVTDGPIEGALLYRDENANGVYDEGEPPFLDADGNQVITDSDGRFDFVTEENLETLRLVAHGGMDTVTGEAVTFDFTAPVGCRMLNPITSTIAAYLETDPGISKEGSEAVVAAAFGLPDLDYCTVDLADFRTELAVQKTAAILATTAFVVKQSGVDGDAFRYIADNMGAYGSTGTLVTSVTSEDGVAGTEVASRLNDTVAAVEAATNLAGINDGLNGTFFSPTNRFTDAGYDADTNTLTLTGTNMNTLLSWGEDAATDVTLNFDWSKLQWDMDSDDADNITFGETDIWSVHVTDASTLVIFLTDTKAMTLEGYPGFDPLDGNDTVEITAGFSGDTAGNRAATDAFDGFSVDTGIVVFDLVHGVSSDHSERTFDADTSYTIYVLLDADDFQNVNTTPTGAADGATWGTWSNADNLGADDTVIVAGDTGRVEYYHDNGDNWVLINGMYGSKNYLGFGGFSSDNNWWCLCWSIAPHTFFRSGPGVTYPVVDSWRRYHGITLDGSGTLLIDTLLIEPAPVLFDLWSGTASVSDIPCIHDGIMPAGILASQRLM